MKSVLLLLAAIFAGAPAMTTNTLAADNASAPLRLPDEGALPSFRGATTWLNSTPLTPEALRGKIVVVDFWTYTCINWLRSFPYVRAWAETYKDQGLVVIGVHSPEFSFEHEADNVRQALADRKIDFPVAIDNDLAVWRDFDNQAWPALYVVDAKGRIRYHQFGEGNYALAEKVIRQLLAEAKGSDLPADLASVDARGPEAPADWPSLQSPENYLGSDRTENFSAKRSVVNKHRVYVAPDALKLNHWAVAGDWAIGAEAIVLNEANGRIKYRFHARDLHLVMGAATRGKSVRFRISIDGQPPGSAHGSDTDEQGNGTVAQPRLYQLLRQAAPIRDRTFEIEFLDPGVQAFSFTFG
jgi:thiol-disulfide isomerase/thioredoxin